MLQLSDDWADTEIDVDGTKGCLRSFAELKKRFTFLKVILSVGGGGKGSDNFAGVARDPSFRQNFAHSCRELVTRFNLDGIDSTSSPHGDVVYAYQVTQSTGSTPRILTKGQTMSSF